MWSFLHLTIFLTVFFFGFSLEWENWDTHSLLQPGSCPNSKSMSLNIKQVNFIWTFLSLITSFLSFFIIHKITGKWIIQHLPWPFPQCCQQPILNFEEDSEEQKKNVNETNILWIRMMLTWPNCKDQSETRHQTLKFHLWQNRITEGTFLIKLPWPFSKVFKKKRPCN